MGIKGLTKLIADEAPDAIKEHKVEHYNGRIIAVDASMAIYQFLIAIRHGNSGGAAAQLTNEAGEVTSHIQGLFNRTIRMLSSGIKPVFVFDGKPPTLKGGELDKRREKREKAEADLKKAQEEANVEEQDRQNKRLVRAGKKESADCKRLLELMGVPFLDAPCEAEAQCAGLAKISKVFAVATEDTDTLTFATPRLLRNMTSAGDNPIKEIDYKKVLEGLQLTPSQFIDLCILMGCDYTSSIRGIGPKSALNLIKKHGDIETILKHLPKDKFQIPPEWLPRVRVRKEKSAVSSPSSSLPPSLPLSSSPSTEEMPAAGAATAASGEEGGREGEEEAEAVNARETAPDEKEKTVVGEVMEEEAEKAVVENEEEVLVEGAEEGSHGAAEDTAGEDAGEEGKEGEEWEWVDQTPAYVMARTLFSHPEIHDPAEQSFKWTEPNEAGLEEFLIDNLGFNPDRVKSGIAKLKASRGAMQQKRLDSFFKPSGSTSSSSSALKRKEAPAVGKGKGKGKAGGKKR